MEKSQQINHFWSISLLLLLGILTSGGVYYWRTHFSGLSSKLVSTDLPSESGSPGETMTINLHFDNSLLNNKNDCSETYPVSREIPKTQTIAQTALTELFAGPTAEEKERGVSSLFSDKTEAILKNIKIENETAYVDLVDIRFLLPGVSSSCGSAAFFAQTENTLKQFPSIKKVVFAIDGKPRTFYEWVQIGCSATDNLCAPEPFK